MIQQKNNIFEEILGLGISIFSHFKKDDINQKRTAAPRTLQYNSALGDNTFGISSLAIV